MESSKVYKIGNATVEIYSTATKEESKKNLIKTYDVINAIADKHRKQGLNVDDWFYTKKQLDFIRKTEPQRFVRLGD